MVKEDEKEKQEEKPSDDDVKRMEESWRKNAPDVARELFNAKRSE